MKHSVPEEVIEVSKMLEKAGFQSYLVGGCVRDVLMGRTPKDWDITTDAKPEEIQRLFPESVYENTFGTVGVKTESKDPLLKVIEVTTFRTESDYMDRRHPEHVAFAKTVEEDLARRDFTMNAIAMSVDGKTIVDPYGGEADFKKNIIRTVGVPEERFHEDALRLMRAVRFATELGFEIEKKTGEAVKKEARSLEVIAKERVRDELIKIIMTSRAGEGIRMLEHYGLLEFVLPELREGVGCGQNKHHIYTVFEHNVRALQYTADQNYSLIVRLASLLHDVGKPRTKRGEGPESTFYNHETVGAKITLKMLDRLRFSKEIVESVGHLVRSHLFYYNVGEVTAAGVRRFLARVGPENIDDLIKVREADRIGSGVPKAVPYKIRHLLFMIEKVKHDPIHPKMLGIRGDDVMKLLNIPAGPKVGQILSVLLEEVLDEPEKNNREYLKERAEKLGKLNEKELIALSEKAKDKKEEFEEGIEEEMKRKFYVK